MNLYIPIHRLLEDREEIAESVVTFEHFSLSLVLLSLLFEFISAVFLLIRSLLLFILDSAKSNPVLKFVLENLWIDLGVKGDSRMFSLLSTWMASSISSSSSGFVEGEVS